MSINDMIPGGPSDGEPPDDGLNKHQQRSAANRATQLLNRATSYILSWLMYIELVNCEVRSDEFERVRWGGGVGMAGLLTRTMEAGKPVVIHLRNKVYDADEKNVEVSDDVIKAFRENGWAVVKGKHLIPISVLHQLANVFPRAVDALAYIGGLCGPLWAGTLLKDCTVTVRTIRTKGKRAAGCDGSGRIHPKHPVFAMLNIAPSDACVIQIRTLNPVTRIFMKGILVPDERCLDGDGNPDIWVDWLQIKGTHKEEAKANAKSSQDPVSTMQVDLGVIKLWNRNVWYSLNFEVLEWIRKTPVTCQIVDAILSENIMSYMERGGWRGIFRSMCQQDENLAFMGKALEMLDLSPKAVPDIANRLDKQVGGFRYLCAQGAGKKSRSCVAVIDNGVPPGHAVMRPLMVDGEWRYTPGTEAAITRYPLVLPQCLRTVKLINPAHAGLDHLLISDNRGGRHVPMWTIYLNEVDLVEGLMGDDDGDVIIMDDDPRVVTLFKNSITFEGFTRDHRFLIEPEEARGFSKSQIRTDTEEGLDIIAKNGMGDVGNPTIWQTKFMELGIPRNALASGVLVQENIDVGKRVVHYTDIRLAADLRNWIAADDGTVRLRDGCKFASDSVYVHSDGSINMDRMSEWMRDTSGRAKTEDLLPWRKTDKRLTLSQCADILKRYDGDINNAKTLLTHCAIRASLLLLKVDAISEPEEIVDLPGVLPRLVSESLGVEVRVPYISYKEYTKTLLKSSGLEAYGHELKRICTPGKHSHAERDAMIEAARVLLWEDLRQMANPRSENYEVELTAKLLQIWVQETTPHPEKRHGPNIKRAFRAILWPGSPILKIVDPDGKGIEGVGCPFMTADRLDATMQYLLKLCNTQSGREEMLQAIPTVNPSIFVATQIGIHRSVKHEAEMGIPLSECPHCVRAISAKVVSEQRKKTASGHKQEIIDLFYKVKKSLGWPDSPERS